MTVTLSCGCRVHPNDDEGNPIPFWELELLHGPCPPAATVRPLHPLLWEGDQA